MPPNRRRARHDGMFHEATAKAKSEAGACAGDDVPPQNRCRQVVRFLFATHAKATAGFTYELECIIVFRVDLHVLLSHREDLAVARSPSGDQLPSPPQARFPSPAQGRTGRGTAQDTGPRPPSDPAIRKVQTYNLPR